jgi:omega-6 fatty acid desaturase (delta-12 desaturase)
MNISTQTLPKTEKSKKPEWVKIVKPYQTPDTWKSAFQVLNSYVPFLLTWYVMYRFLDISYLVTLGLALLAAGFMMRIFIIQHDCGHGSFFKSRKANDILGAISGVITLTPYHRWRTHHARHHASSGDLDFRGIGDVDTITVEEYLSRDWWGRFKYRFFRHPLFLFLIAPSIIFLILHRFPYKTSKGEKRARNSVYWTNAALLGVTILLGSWIGYRQFFMVQLPISIFGAAIGVYLFYVQHQFEETYWRYHPDWDFESAALEGSSYLKLPKVLQWFSGNIGYHHVHHLSPLIPNYRLEQAHEENEIFQQVHTLTLGSSFSSIFLSLWDEKKQKLVAFRDVQQLRAGV